MLATLTDIEIHTDGLKSFKFKPEQPLDYIAGQFVEVSLPASRPAAEVVGRTSSQNSSHDDNLKRWFTLSSSPTEGFITITMRVGGKRRTFKQLLDKLKPGGQVMVSDALGDFVLPLDTSIPLVWMAAGIGITPFRSMAVWMHDNHEKRDVELYHSAPADERRLFAAEMKRAGIVSPRLHSRTTDGRISASDILGQSPDDGRRLYYAAGPDAYVAGAITGLKAAGIPLSRIVSDIFTGYQ